MNTIDSKARDIFLSNLRDYRDNLDEMAVEQPEYFKKMVCTEVLERQFSHAAANLTESPIEQMMLAALMFVASGYGSAVAECRQQNCPGELPEAGLCLMPQFKVSDYRVDLALFCRGFDGSVLMLAIECDGHDWHEKTKGQARRDRKRDRALQSLGWQTVRFAGSEIFDDANECANEIGDILTDHYERGFPADMKDSPFYFMNLKWQRAGFEPPYAGSNARLLA